MKETHTMQSKPVNKYALKDVHQEIDLFDRKISYCQSLERFESDDARATALQKLTKRREILVRLALEAARDGVPVDPKFLPRSFKQATTAEKV
jgi:hypothetical protein